MKCSPEGLLRGTGHRKVSSVFPDLARLDPLIEKMTRQIPAERHSSIAEIEDELARV